MYAETAVKIFIVGAPSLSPHGICAGMRAGNEAAIYVLAGVNGSGKSSIGGAAITARGAEYYNPDTVARKLRQIHPNITQPIANSHAWTLGKDMLENGRSQLLREHLI